MAKIQTGNFGFAVPRTSPGIAGVGGVGAPGRALANIGETTRAIAGDIQHTQDVEAARQRQEEERIAREQEAERKAAEKEAARARALTAQVTHENEVNAIYDQLNTDLEQGKITRDQLPDLFNKQSAEIRKKSLEGIDPDHTPILEAGFSGVEGKLSRKLAESADNNRKQEVASHLNITLEELSRMGLRDPETAKLKAKQVIEAQGPMIGMTADKMTQAVQDFNEKTTANFVTQSIATDPRGTLKLLKKGEFADLQPETRLRLLSHAESSVETIERRAEIHAAKVERQNRETFDSFVSLVSAGKNPSPEYTASITQKLKGTPYAKAVNEMLAQAPAQVSFAAAPLKAQEQNLQALLVKGNDPKRGWTPEEQKQYTQFEQVHQKTKADIKADPYQAALERGVIPAIAPLDIGDVNTLGAQLATRAEQTQIVSQWTGKPESPLRPAEAEQVASIIQSLPPKQRSAALSTVAKAVNNPAQMRALAGQFGKVSDTISTAAYLASKDLVSTRGRHISEMYLNGADALEQGRAKIDQTKETGVRAQIYSELNGVYSSKPAMDMAADATFKIYAGLKAEGDDDLERAIRIANGSIINHNGQKIAARGFDEGDVEDAIARIKPADLGGNDFIASGHSISAQDLTARLPSLPLRNAPSGYYVQAGADVVRHANGQPLVIQLRK